MPNAMSPAPIHEELTLTIEKASEITNISINKIHIILHKPDCPFVSFMGKEICKAQGV